MYTRKGLRAARYVIDIAGRANGTPRQSEERARLERAQDRYASMVASAWDDGNEDAFDAMAPEAP